MVAAEIGRAQLSPRPIRHRLPGVPHRRSHPSRSRRNRHISRGAAYLVGNTDQAFAIFRELLAGGARRPLPGGDPARGYEIPRRAGGDRDAAGVSSATRCRYFAGLGGGGRVRRHSREVAEAMAAPMGDRPFSSLTAQAGPAVIWEFIFDDDQRLVEMVLQVEHLDLYTPYRLEIRGIRRVANHAGGPDRGLGEPPNLTNPGKNGDIVMEWQFENHLVVATFGSPRITARPTPIGAATLRTLRLRATTPLLIRWSDERPRTLAGRQFPHRDAKSRRSQFLAFGGASRRSLTGRGRFRAGDQQTSGYRSPGHSQRTRQESEPGRSARGPRRRVRSSRARASCSSKGTGESVAPEDIAISDSIVVSGNTETLAHLTQGQLTFARYFLAPRLCRLVSGTIGAGDRREFVARGTTGLFDPLRCPDGGPLGRCTRIDRHRPRDPGGCGSSQNRAKKTQPLGAGWVVKAGGVVRLQR